MIRVPFQRQQMREFVLLPHDPAPKDVPAHRFTNTCTLLQFHWRCAFDCFFDGFIRTHFSLIIAATQYYRMCIRLSRFCAMLRLANGRRTSRSFEKWYALTE